MTYSKGLPFQYPRSFHWKATDTRTGVLPSVFTHIPSHWRNSLSPEEIHFIFHNTMRKVISYADPKSVLLEPTSSSLCSHATVPCKSNRPCLHKTALEYLETEDTASLALFPTSLHALRPVAPSSSSSVNTGTWSGSELNSPRLFQQHNERPAAFLWCFYQCGLTLPMQALLETSVPKLSDLRNCGRKCSSSLVPRTIFSSYPQKFLSSTTCPPGRTSPKLRRWPSRSGGEAELIPNSLQ